MDLQAAAEKANQFTIFLPGGSINLSLVLGKQSDNRINNNAREHPTDYQFYQRLPLATKFGQGLSGVLKGESQKIILPVRS